MSTPEGIATPPVDEALASAIERQQATQQAARAEAERIARQAEAERRGDDGQA